MYIYFLHLYSFLVWEVFNFYLIPPDKSVGVGLTALVCIFQFHISATDLRRAIAICRKLTDMLVISLFYRALLLLSVWFLLCRSYIYGKVY